MLYQLRRSRPPASQRRKPLPLLGRAEPEDQGEVLGRNERSDGFAVSRDDHALAAFRGANALREAVLRLGQ
jgi:hypothetical protein